jgi:hydrogenase maturation protease
MQVGVPGNQTVIIGVGNPFRSDDVLGLAVVRELRGILPDDVLIIEHSGEGAGLMSAWENAASLIIVDAIRSGAPPGTIHRIDLTAGLIPSYFSIRSSHLFGVVEAIKTARTLGRMPRRALLIGVEAEAFDYGTSMSDAVQSAFPGAIDAVLRGLNDYAGPAQST